MLKYETSDPTDSPLAFMNVCGLASITGTFAIKPFPKRALNWMLLTEIPSASAIASIISKPTLWRVDWYFLPGLPSPTRSQGLGFGLGLGSGPGSGEGRVRVCEEARDENRGMLFRGDRATEYGNRRALAAAVVEEEKHGKKDILNELSNLKTREIFLVSWVANIDRGNR